MKAPIREDAEQTAKLHRNLVLAAREKLGDLADRVNYWVVANEVLAGNKKELQLLGQYERKRMDLAKGKTAEEGKHLV